LCLLLAVTGQFIRRGRQSQDRTELLLAQLQDAREAEAAAAALAERGRAAGPSIARSPDPTAAPRRRSGRWPAPDAGSLSDIRLHLGSQQADPRVIGGVAARG